MFSWRDILQCIKPDFFLFEVTYLFLIHPFFLPALFCVDLQKVVVCISAVDTLEK